ncbi:hypothetical protein [Pedobacter sp. B4-66]|uniref:hypothetical protein n=1 Tax=Pedobacter sp. B4-66 TaxID=2817280 RepID=UPI001BDAB8B3|nr:hypothetical protein [Pedobacter sp. B4-66]
MLHILSTIAKDMTDQKIVRTETAEVLLFDLNQESGQIKIGFGVSFCLHEGKLCVSEIPFLSLNLSPIENITIDNGTLQFDALLSEKTIHFIIKSECPGAEGLMLFIKQLSEKPLLPAPTFNNSIYLQVDSGELLLRLEDCKTNNRILITYSNTYGNHITQRFPEPSKRYKIESCNLTNDILTVQCDGHNLYQDHTSVNPELNTTYQWHLVFQSEVQKIIHELISTNIGSNF